MPVEPLEQDLEALDPVSRRARARELVRLDREADELDLLPGTAKRDEQMFRLLDRAAEVVLRMHDQERRLDVLRIGRRRTLDPRVEVVVEKCSERPAERPEDVARPVGGDEVV